jgi:uncharacterized protein involved in exopolysaccharide biosynthesis
MEKQINSRQVISEQTGELVIDFIQIFKIINKKKGTLLLCIVLGLILGVSLALLSPKEYTATTVMVPQMSGKTSAMGGLGSLAALAGIDLSNTSQSNEISPILYPKIVTSTPFKLELMNTPLKFEKFNKPISLYQYYTNDTIPTFFGVIKKYTVGLPGLIIELIKPNEKRNSLKSKEDVNLIELTEEQEEVSKKLEKLINLEVEAKEGYLTLTVIMNEPLAAAQLAQKAQELLQREITNFKSQKAKAELDFIQERYNEAQAKAEGYQLNIAQKTDQYKNLTSSVPQVQTSRIQTKYSIANTVFQELAKQLEQAKIQVKKDTPIFTVIQPVTIPLEKSKPNRPMIIIFGILLGGFVGLLIIIGKEVMSALQRKWNESC